MTSRADREVVIVGGGIVGMATALAIAEGHGVPPLVLEAEATLGVHQTGRNSGVVHSGLYYAPGSAKASNCVAGREAMYEFCRQHDVPHERCGKLVVATEEAELPHLAELERRGRANGLAGIRALDGEELPEYEPHVTGIAGLWVPETGIVDYRRVTQVMARRVTEAGGEVRTGTKVEGLRRTGRAMEIRTPAGPVRARHLINCAGLQSDRVARMAGVDPGVRIAPFRGEYYELVPGKRHLVRGLIYPVPDPRYPFLGVHFTRRIDGSVDAGPNAVPALKRDAYDRWAFSLRDTVELLGYPAWWRMSARHWRTGLRETYRSLFKSAFVAALRRMIPAISPADLRPAPSGVRAQALESDGTLVDDFRVVAADGMLHVLNAPSPAATASIAIGRDLAARAAASFGW